MTLIAVLSGIAFVLIGILAFRMHAVLALLGGAVVTALVTDPETRRLDILENAAQRVDSYTQIAGVDRWNMQFAKSRKLASSYDIVSLTESGALNWIGSFVPDGPGTPTELGGQSVNGRVLVKNSAGEDLSQARSWLLPSGSIGEVRSSLSRSLGSRLAFGFGRTAGKIGLVIALAAVIGQALLHSGAADRIVRTSFAFTGERGAPAAFVVSGFILGIPVFFDTVFYLMIPLGKALYARTRRNYLMYVLTIICGGTMAHSLVPPTPGPLLVASELNVPIAKMIGYGCTVGLVTAIVGYFYAAFIGSRWELTPPEDVDTGESQTVDPEDSPSFTLSLLPILLPLGLITVASLLKANAASSMFGYQFLQAVGDKNIALLIAATISLGLLLRWNRSRRPASELVSEALASGAMIVLITGAGGAFGSVLQESGLRGLIEELPPMSTPMLLTIAFLITTAVRTAQGSATVAMITTVALFADLAIGDTLAFDPVYLACAIGCGSKPVAWMADSGFWVMTRLSGMTPQQGLKFITPMTAFMGVAGLLTTIALATLFPGV